MSTTRRKSGDVGKGNGTTVTRGSGNVFADLELPHAEERKAKADLAAQIAALVDGRTQVEAARLLGIAQPKVSALLRGKLADFSTERLMRLLVRLGQTVEIHVKPTRSKARPRHAGGHLLVV